MQSVGQTTINVDAHVLSLMIHTASRCRLILYNVQMVGWPRNAFVTLLCGMPDWILIVNDGPTSISILKLRLISSTEDSMINSPVPEASILTCYFCSDIKKGKNRQ